MSNVGRHLRHGLRFGALYTCLALLLVLMQASSLSHQRSVWRAQARAAALAFVVSALGGAVYSYARERTGRLRAGALGGACGGLAGAILRAVGGGAVEAIAAAVVFVPVGAACGILAALLYGTRGPRDGRAPHGGAA